MDRGGRAAERIVVEDSGFTLVELLIATTLSAFILGSIVLAFVVALTGSSANSGPEARMLESHDSQLVSTYLPEDLQSATSADPTSSASTGCSSGVNPSGVNVVTLQWMEQLTVRGPTITYSAAYHIESAGTGTTIVRYYCAVGSPAQSLVVAKRLRAPKQPGTYSDASTTNNSTTVTSTSASFVAGDVGELVTASTIPLGTTVTAVTSPSVAVLSNRATGTGAGLALTVASHQLQICGDRLLLSLVDNSGYVYSITGSPRGTLNGAPACPSPPTPTAVGAVTFSESPLVAGSPPAGYVPATWTVQFTTSGTVTNPNQGALAAGSTITLTAPPGTAWSQAVGDYGVTDGHNRGATVGSVTATATGSSTTPNQVQLGLSSSGVDGTDPVTVAASTVANPPAASYGPSNFSVSTLSDLSPVSPSSGQMFVTTNVSALSFTAGSMTGSAPNVQWTVQFTTSPAGALLAPPDETLTITAPTGTLWSAAATDFVVTDFGGHIETVASVSGPGGSPTPTNVVVVDLSASGITNLDKVTVVAQNTLNPPPSTYAKTAFSLATSTDVTAANPGAGLTFTPPAPSLSGLIAEDANHNGKIDTVVATFTDVLAGGGCGNGWVVTGVPSSGSPGTVTAPAGGTTVTLNLSEGSGAPDTTTPPSFKVSFTPTSCNATGFAPTTPTDQANPVVISVTDNESDGSAGDGKLQPGDSMTITFSEQVIDYPGYQSGPPFPTSVQETDGGPGNHDTIAIAGITDGALDTGSSGYINVPGNGTGSATFAATITPSGGGSTLIVTVPVGTACQDVNGGCAQGALGSSRGTFVFLPLSTLQDAAGNKALAQNVNPVPGNNFRLW